MAKSIDDFIAELNDENEQFFSALPDKSTQYWTDSMTAKGAIAALKPRWFNELRGIEVIGRFAARVPDITLKTLVGKQVGDEAKHAWLCKQRIEQLGGTVLDYKPTPEQLAFGDLLDEMAYPEEFFAAQQFTVETQSLKRNELALNCFDETTAEMFRRHINPDERFHVQLGWLGLKTFARTRVAQTRARDAARKIREIHSTMVTKHRERMSELGLFYEK